MRSIVFMLASVALLAGCNEDEEETAPSAPAPSPSARPAEEPVQALPAVEVSMPKVVLGRRLYHDPILSGDGTISCATCHALDAGGAEARRTSNGIRGQSGPINAPTVFNAHFHFRQFWDGRARDLQDQAAGPVENPLEMGTTFPEAIARLKTDPWYVERFAAVYPGDDPITKEHVTDAIAEYERYLVTPSPFDAFLRGETDAIDERAKRGYATFKDVGCTACHNGVAIGGSMFQKMGLVADYFALRGGEITEADLGRFNVTHQESDRHFFKVPSLRNVALTAPYFHDGSQAELSGAVRVMGRVQLGRELTDAQVADIVAFLGTLTGTLPADAALPESEAPPARTAPAAD